jgi:hypothetical protein
MQMNAKYSYCDHRNFDSVSQTLVDDIAQKKYALIFLGSRFLYWDEMGIHNMG